VKRVRPITFAMFAFLGALLVACEPMSMQAPTVSYFRTHEAERRERVAECANDPARAKRDAACINALAAERIEGIGSYRDLPALKLPSPQSDNSPEHERPASD
jgi:hypothetical protein